MKKATAITCVFLDIGGVLLTDGWDRHARKRATTSLKLDRRTYTTETRGAPVHLAAAAILSRQTKRRML
jgi:hypothetical protein